MGTILIRFMDILVASNASHLVKHVLKQDIVYLVLLVLGFCMRASADMHVQTDTLFPLQITQGRVLAKNANPYVINAIQPQPLASLALQPNILRKILVWVPAQKGFIWRKTVRNVKNVLSHAMNAWWEVTVYLATKAKISCTMASAFRCVLMGPMPPNKFNPIMLGPSENASNAPKNVSFVQRSKITAQMKQT